MRSPADRFVPSHYPPLPWSQLEILLEMTAFTGLIFQGIILLRWWSMVPPSVPTHFGTSGLPDAWGAKGTLILLPAVSIGLYLLMTFLSRFPRLFNYPVRLTPENYLVQYSLARSLLSCIKAETIWIFACISYQTIQTSLGKGWGLGAAFVPLVLIIMFGTTGIYFAQAYQNK